MIRYIRYIILSLCLLTVGEGIVMASPAPAQTTQQDRRRAEAKRKADKKRKADQKRRQAAKKKADDLARKASASAVNQVRDIIRTEVKSAVDKAYADVKKSVAEELRRQVADIDISDVKEEVVERAKDKAAEKFESALDGVLNNFNDNLQNVAKIYSSIAKTFSEKS